MSAAPRYEFARYEFGDFVLDPAQRRVVRRDGGPVTLTPRLFDALLLFVERAGDLLDKDTLLAALWPGLVVEENNLSQVISGLRRALGDDPQDSRYIQTVPRRGFRFVAAVKSLPAEPAADSAPASRSDAKADAKQEAAVTAEDSTATPAPLSATPEPPPATAAPMPASSSPQAAAIGIQRENSPLRRRLIGSAITAAGAVAAAVWLWRHRADPGPPTPTTLAVLPFKPLVLEGRDELLEVGMADSLIARLSTLPGLVVRSVGSVRRYAGADQDPLRAAQELNVAWIVDGSLQRWGDQVRVTARLLRAGDGAALWSGSFDEKFTGMFDVQDAISERVARVIAPNLKRQERDRLTGTGGTRNPQAYQLYLDARRYAQSIRADGLKKSITLYQQALALDPNYALAYAGAAESYRRMIFGADAEPRAVFEPAKLAVKRALDIDPGLAEAHALRGWITFWYEWDWAAAEAQFRRAIELNPNVVEAHFGRGHLALALGRHDEALKSLQTARELDPMSLILNSLEASHLLDAGRREEGLARLQRVLDIEPNFWVAHLTMAGFHLSAQQPAEALASIRRADQLADRSTQAAAVLGLVLGRAGEREEARAVLQRLLELQKSRYVPPTSIAAVHVGLGDTQAALDALERAYEVRDARLAYMKDDGRWASLRSEPRFVALLKRMKLEPASAAAKSN